MNGRINRSVFLVMEYPYPWGPCYGTWRGAPLPETLRKRHIKRELKMPCKPVSFFVWAPLGNLEGFACWDFRVERIVLLGFFLGHRGH